MPPSQVKLARKVEISYVRQRDLTYTVDTVGTLEPERQTSIASGVTGIVDDVLFREGDVVDPQSTILVKIDQQKYEAALALAKANEQRADTRLTAAQDLADRAEKLLARNAISQEDLTQRKLNLDVAKAELLAAQAERQLAETILAKSRVRPPYRGQINERRVAAGDYLKEETVIATMADLSRLRLSAFVPELAAPRVKTADIVEFTLEAIPQKRFRAKISFLSTVADPETHMFALKADVVEIDPEMKPGMFARLQLVIGAHPRAVVVPEESVRAGEQGFVVFVPEPEKSTSGETRYVARLRPIQPGLRRPGFVEVLSGVQPNEQIVTRGSEALEDGTPVEFADAPPPTPDVPTGG